MTPEEIAAKAAADKAAADKAAADAAAADKLATDAAVRAASGNVTIPANAIGRIKKDERERGRKAAVAELDAVAKQHGFESHAEALAFMGDLKKNGGKTSAQVLAEKKAADAAAAAAATTADKPDYRTRQREEQYRKDMAKLQADSEKNRRAAARATADKERSDALFTLALKAQEAGISGSQNVQFALFALEKAAASMTPEEVQALDEKKFFAALGDQLPNLRGAGEKKLLTTGTVAGAGAGAGQAGDSKSVADAKAAAEREAYLRRVGAVGPAGTGSAAGTKNGMDMTQEEFAEALKRNGLTPDFGHGITMVSRGGLS
jgi:hypothetical protein